MVKRTLQEIADFFGMALAMDEDGSWYLYTAKPSLANGRWCGNGNILCGLSRDLVDYSGDWRESLTLPESWTKEPPFREGELVISKSDGMASRWGHGGVIFKDDWRRPTEAEWKVLKGKSDGA